MTDPTPTPAAPKDADKRPQRPKSAPVLPDESADVEDWEEFQQVYAGWVEKATDTDLLAEMAALPEAGRPLSPAEAWMYHQCELRRRRPTDQRAAAGRRK